MKRNTSCCCFTTTNVHFQLETPEIYMFWVLQNVFPMSLCLIVFKFRFLFLVFFSVLIECFFKVSNTPLCRKSLLSLPLTDTVYLTSLLLSSLLCKNKANISFSKLNLLMTVECIWSNDSIEKDDWLNERDGEKRRRSRWKHKDRYSEMRQIWTPFCQHHCMTQHRWVSSGADLS